MYWIALKHHSCYINFYLNKTYFKNFEILFKKEQGLNDEGEQYFKEKWRQAFIKHQPSLKLSEKEIIERVEANFNKRNIHMKWDKIKRFKQHLHDFMALRFNEESKLNKIFTFKFQNIFHAAGFKK